MDYRKVIPCLDVKDGRLVKGVHFVDLKEVGDPAEAAAAYSAADADELVFLDITATVEGRKTMADAVKRTAERIIVELREKVAGRATDDIVVRRTASDDPRTLAREGLLGLGFTPQEADRLLEQSGGDSPEELIQGALRAAR